MSNVDLQKLRRALGLNQTQLSDTAMVAKSIISRVENQKIGLSLKAAQQVADVVKVPAAILYGSSQLVAIKAKHEAAEISDDSAAEKLMKVLRTLVELKDQLPDTEETEVLLDSLEESLAETTGVAVKALREGYTAADYDPIGHDGRDLWGRKAAYMTMKDARLRPEDYGTSYDTGNLSDPYEQEFEDVGSFGVSPNQHSEREDPFNGPDDDGRDIFGRRVRPLR